MLPEVGAVEGTAAGKEAAPGAVPAAAKGLVLLSEEGVGCAEADDVSGAKTKGNADLLAEVAAVPLAAGAGRALVSGLVGNADPNEKETDDSAGLAADDGSFESTLLVSKCRKVGACCTISDCVRRSLSCSRIFLACSCDACPWLCRSRRRRWRYDKLSLASS